MARVRRKKIPISLRQVEQILEAVNDLGEQEEDDRIAAEELARAEEQKRTTEELLMETTQTLNALVEIVAGYTQIVLSHRRQVPAAVYLRDHGGFNGHVKFARRLPRRVREELAMEALAHGFNMED